MGSMKNVNHQEMREALAESLGFEAAHWALGRYFQIAGKSGRDQVWGLFVIEKNRDLHFVSFNQDNWFSSLMKTARNDSGKPSVPEGALRMHLVFPADKTVSLVRVRKRGLFSFLQKSFPLFHMEMEGRDIREIFELEDPGQAFLDALTGESEAK